MRRTLPMIQRIFLYNVEYVQKNFNVDELTSFYMAEALTMND